MSSGGHPGSQTTNIEDIMSNTVTLSTLNSNDNPTKFAGQMISNDGQGNSLWLFGDKVANRLETEDGEIFWSADVKGWNYTTEDAIPA